MTLGAPNMAMIEKLRSLWDDGKLRVCCGCGDYPLPFWTNIDSDPKVSCEIHAEVPPLPFDDGEVDEVYAGHFIEHLDRQTAADFLAECFRVLTPGGKCGIVVPDTRIVMERWLRGDVDAVEVPPGVWWSIADLDHVCAAFLYGVASPTPHLWSWDATTLKRAMQTAGFVNFVPIDRYRDVRLGSGAFYQVGFDGYKFEAEP